MHVMIDLETLSTHMDAAVLSIGAVRFTPEGIRPYPFYQTISVDSNIQFGRRIDGKTLAWWMQQSDAARAAAFNEAEAGHMAAVLQSFAVWLLGAALDATGEAEEVYLWGNGANFDISILESAYASVMHPVPWNFRNVRCMRTIRALADARHIEKTPNPVEHHALEDARAQADWLMRAWAAGIGCVEGV